MWFDQCDLHTRTERKYLIRQAKVFDTKLENRKRHVYYKYVTAPDGIVSWVVPYCGGIRPPAPHSEVDVARLQD